MPDTVTVPDSTVRPSGDSVDTLAIAVGWSPPDEPPREGAVAFLPRGEKLTVGRGDAPNRLPLAHVRPGTSTLVAPLGADVISAAQLELQGTLAGPILLVTGKCPTFVNGLRVAQGFSKILEVGDTIRLYKHLLLHVVRRPRMMPTLKHFPMERAADVPGAPNDFGFAGESPLLWAVLDLIAAATKSGMHLLLLGETGTGKELAARMFHALSERKGTFVECNVAGISENLEAAEFFGLSRDYPNKGMPERPGMVGAAEHGTLFLDEIGEVSHAIHAILLRLLEGSYMRPGESRVRRPDMRIVAATNRPEKDLKLDFRRRFPIEIVLPSLDLRREDIPSIVRHLLKSAAEDPTKPNVLAQEALKSGAITAALMERLLLRKYPGNVRELHETMWRAIMGRDDPEPAPETGREEDDDEDDQDIVLEEGAVREALKSSRSNVTRAAKKLRVSRTTLRRFLDKNAIKVE